jgi:hypothetical protein
MTRISKLTFAAAALGSLLGNVVLAGDPASLATYQNDPRSNAAIIRDLVKSGKIVPKAAVPHRASRTLTSVTVNDPTMDLTISDTQSETSIADFGNGKLVAAFNDSGAFGPGSAHFTGFAYSLNGGVSWIDGGSLPTSTNGDFGDPVLAPRLGTNRVYLSTLSGALPEIQVFRSTNAGQTWSAPVNGAPGFGAGNNQDKQWLAVDNFSGANAGNVYMCWTRFGATEDIFFTRSTDGGLTFGPNGGTLISSGGQGCFVTVSPNHQVSVFYYRGTGAGGQGGDNKIFMRRSTNGGVSFAPEVQVADLNTTSTNGNLNLNGGVRSNAFPHAAVNPDPAKPFIYVVYNDDPNLVDTADNGNIFMVMSTNAGATWSAPIAVDNGSRDQFFPTIGFAGPGKLLVGYYSRALDPDNLLFQRKGRQATLNAAGVPVFGKSFQMGPYNPPAVGQDPVINSTYMGDYDQIAGGNGKFSSTWADNRSGNLFHANQPDVRFASISATPPAADVAVTAALSRTSQPAGLGTQLKVHVTSAGGTANDVFLTLRDPRGLIVSGPSATSCTKQRHFMGCSLGSIGNGQSRDLYFTLRGAAPAATRSLFMTATTSSKDPTSGNNSLSLPVTVTAGGVTTSSYSTGNIAVAINDNTTVEIPLSVADVGTVVGATALVRLNHTFDGDLTISLVPPRGPALPLAVRRGGGGANYGTGANSCAGAFTVFDESALSSIVSGTAPFAGTFQPEGRLTSTLGLSSKGTWKLRVQDSAAVDTGTVGCFQLNIARLP